MDDLTGTAAKNKTCFCVLSDGTRSGSWRQLVAAARYTTENIPPQYLRSNPAAVILFRSHHIPDLDFLYFLGRDTDILFTLASLGCSHMTNKSPSISSFNSKINISDLL
ncbi:hypothetical protein SERLA73DRAFT_79448 [Serpula lacrymans var. lacrymans S7.3]|uniref:Uncharacterized protein n=1 Tax=Serpula lacrymans var. lacrymans (strain S7.3) TaxID=936435 RepID=F8QGG1_SERL3|nr:hypothetical protein SERLA73DRAFT_79448 [Serpula lacrymans var. lacrymans S7.3]